MSASEGMPDTPVSKAETLEEVADFWDTHSLADHWDQTREVHFEVRASRRHRVTLDPDVYARVQAHAQARGVLPETLVNLWLSERLTPRRESGDRERNGNLE